MFRKLPVPLSVSSSLVFDCLTFHASNIIQKDIKPVEINTVGNELFEPSLLEDKEKQLRNQIYDKFKPLNPLGRLNCKTVHL